MQLLNAERFSLREMLSVYCDSAAFNGEKKSGIF